MWVLMVNFYDSENNVRVIYKDMTLFTAPWVKSVELEYKSFLIL